MMHAKRGFVLVVAAALVLTMALALPWDKTEACPVTPLLMWPNKNSRLSGCYRDDVRGYEHLAIDLAGGKQIYACEQGTVVQSMYDETWGNTVLIRHDGLKVDGKYIYTEYAHMDKRLVERGDVVKRGQQIGVMGKTGRDIQHVHLHLMVKLSERADYDSLYKDGCVDPAIYLETPTELGKGFGTESACCDAYYESLISHEEREGMLQISDETVTRLSDYTSGNRLKGELTGKISTEARVNVNGKNRSRWITYVHVQIQTQQGEQTYSYTAFPNRDEFELGNLQLSKEICDLSPGAYRILVIARDEAGYQKTLIDHRLTVLAAETEHRNREMGTAPLTGEELACLDEVALMASTLPACTNTNMLTGAELLGILTVNYWHQGLALAGIAPGKEQAELSYITASAFVKSVLGVPLPEEGRLMEEDGVTVEGGKVTVPFVNYGLYPYRVDVESIRGGAVRARYLLLTAAEKQQGPSETRLNKPDLIFTASRGGVYYGFTVLSIEQNIRVDK